jgi:hypothetical protein
LAKRSRISDAVPEMHTSGKRVSKIFELLIALMLLPQKLFNAKSKRNPVVP